MEPSTPPESLRVAVALTLADASLISEWILARNRRIDEQVPAVDGHEQWVEVKISGGTYDYDVLVRAMRDGVALKPIGELAHCECTSGKLLELVDERIAAAVEQLQEAARAQEPDPEPEEPPPHALPESERRGISGLGIGGVVTTVLGTGMVGGGLVMVMGKPTSIPDSYLIRRDWTLPGIVTLAVGGAALAAGISMVAADVVQCRRFEAPRRCERRRRGTKQLTLDVGPSFEVNGGGFTISGRF